MQQTLIANAAKVGVIADLAPHTTVAEVEAVVAAAEQTPIFDSLIPIGAHVSTPRRWYTHHGIYVGAGQVVHYAGLSSTLRCGPVTKVSLAEFMHGHPVCVCHDADVAYSSEEVVSRACSRLGEDAYDVLRNNCEHFCSWCLTGAARSRQVERWLPGTRAAELAIRLLSGLTGGWGASRDANPLMN
ncbi:MULTISPECIES: lecithin retinol acyltransferase family protein [unclassified Paraburkholderia]|uniref:lecithin retinol acyltransferase family protein n=1 Tax=unclassified Paraburkholderia TaxID=2615204 RepID=UPI002AB6A5D3|nr:MULTISPECIES: lecithin retinol acyltransferase family protein [unclassified Paraburkholderia]